MSFSFAFRPRIVDALRGYNHSRALADLGAGATVGVVALPLAMAFAIASGLPPQAGLWTAIIGGFLVALLGGTNVQIGGPAGAFIVIVYGIVERYGVANLLISTACAGVLLFALGLLRLGSLVRFVPVSIVIGFTNGIAVLIAVSQLKDFLGLAIDKMPGNFFSQVHVMALHVGTVNPYALGLGAACLAGLFLWPRLFMHDSPVLRMPGGHTVRSFVRIPAPVVALITLTALSHGMGYPVETLGTRFGGIPQSLPVFALPEFSWDTVRLLVAPTITIALLGAIESLLCARVADQLADSPYIRKHDPNQELMAQGVANFVVPFFGGMPVTGTIARTVTNLRAGATSPVAGIVHAATLAAIVLVAAPLALHIPLAVLAGILLHVAWNMGEWHEFARLKHFSNHYRLLLLGTFFLTVVFDLTVAVQVGLVLACALFVRRMSELFRAEPETPVQAGVPNLAWRLHGVLFFGAASKVDPLVEAIEAAPLGVQVRLDASDLFALDTTGLEGLEQILKAVTERGGRLTLCGAQEQPASLLERSGFNARLAAQSAAPQPSAAASPPGHSPSSGETPG
ncbi:MULTISPECIES: SulP family inorganic anion transporter [unclassified Simplicispira]|uniref:SulP family inorganic anion transporter n=1 Tax=unclassified Simplicispira TaxID=2630407 RepID=UPI000D5F1ACE|nr:MULTISPECIES: SulP family inorganic anion transporter [unclassified Simplicispira]PVY56650.1 SulP family sulfate permease [Simplicispira sp. 125]REG17594.1 SulP family sulfate permease [Simplicispira sp. 110]